MSADRQSFVPELRDAEPGTEGSRAPDRRDGAVYVMTDELHLAVDVALATGRPLLLRGEPGSGKSSLAGFVARNLGWRYYEHVVTSRTVGQDLLWSFDPMRKLADASAARELGAAALDDARYVEPGVLWWALDRRSALHRGDPERADADDIEPADEPFVEVNRTRDPRRAVVLIDEIDKADPDVPNALLVPLGSAEFLVTPTRYVVTPPPDDGSPTRLVVITTNEERELPPAFLRRCVVLTLPGPTAAGLTDIARRHLRHSGQLASAELVAALVAKFFQLRKEMLERAERPPSTAEFLDALHTCRQLGIEVDDERWPTIEQLVLSKPRTGTGGR